MNDFKTRLKQARREAKLTQKQLADRAHTTQQAISNLERGLTEETSLTVQLAVACGVSPQWLQSGTGPQRKVLATDEEGTQSDISGQQPGRYAVVRRYGDVIHGGTTALTLEAREEIVEHVSIERGWLRHFLHIDPQHAVLVTVHGDSMAPVLEPGELVIVDRADCEPRDAIFVIRLEGQTLVKRLQKRLGAIRVISTNKEYPSFDVTGEDQRFEIIGRVVYGWQGRKF